MSQDLRTEPNSSKFLQGLPCLCPKRVKEQVVQVHRIKSDL